MSVQMNGVTYYRTSEACRIAGISKNTYLRWTREGQLQDIKQRDRRGWRLFTEQDLSRLVEEATRVDRVGVQASDAAG
ncbi:MAG: helix-turn-helix domain-containing protein [Dehalococcoidia bacterium]|nr:MAG: helix-turn-helix domain-containing protein [Dehalococcoidia bacterium]